MNLVRICQGRNRAGGQPQMTFAARAVAGDGDAVLASRNQPLEVSKDWSRHLLTQPRNFGFLPRRDWLRGQLMILQCEQILHDLSHGFALSQTSCREKPLPL